MVAKIELESPFSAEVTNTDIEVMFPGYQQTVQNALVAKGIFEKDEEISFFDAPQKHMYKDGRISNALYVAELRKDGKKIYVSVLNGITSPHYHEYGIEEDYDLLDGEASVNGFVLEKGITFTVKPETLHQVKTEGKPGLLLIVMHGVEGISDEHIHKHPKNLYRADVELDRAISEGFPHTNLGE